MKLDSPLLGMKRQATHSPSVAFQALHRQLCLCASKLPDLHIILDLHILIFRHACISQLRDPCCFFIFIPDTGVNKGRGLTKSRNQTCFTSTVFYIC